MQAKGVSVSSKLGLFLYLAVKLSKDNFDFLPETGIQVLLYLLKKGIIFSRGRLFHRGVNVDIMEIVWHALYIYC